MDSSLEKQYSLEELMPLIREALEQGKNVRFSPRGTSMLPMLRQGVDSVVFSPLPRKLRKYDLPLYRRKSGQYVLHRIVEAGDSYTCVGDNQFELERGLGHEQMIALVTGFYRGDTYHRTDSLPHRLYCRLWHRSRPVRHLWRRAKGWLRRRLP